MKKSNHKTVNWRANHLVVSFLFNTVWGLHKMARETGGKNHIQFPLYKEGFNMWCITENATWKCCYLLEVSSKIWARNGRIGEPQENQHEMGPETLFCTTNVKNTEISLTLHEDSCSAERRGQNNSTRRDIAAERCCGCLKLSMREISTNILGWQSDERAS